MKQPWLVWNETQILQGELYVPNNVMAPLLSNRAIVEQGGVAKWQIVKKNQPWLVWNETHSVDAPPNQAIMEQGGDLTNSGADPHQSPSTAQVVEWGITLVAAL